MMKSVLFSLVALFSVSAQAQDLKTHEIYGGSNAGLKFGSAIDSSLGLSAGYFYLLADGLQIGAETAIGWNFDKSLLNVNNAFGGMTFNIPMNDAGLMNAIFIRALVGFEKTPVTGSAVQFAYKAAVGKRISLADNISWNPNFGIRGQTQTGAKPEFAVELVNLSIFF